MDGTAYPLMTASGHDRQGESRHTWRVRERVAAIVEREGLVLMVVQRARSESGRHDGFEYLTLPGGGVKPGESPFEAVAREVDEEVCLRVSTATFVHRIEHVGQHGTATSIFYTEVEDGLARLGVDPELVCDCPWLVGIEWMTAPSERLGVAPKRFHS